MKSGYPANSERGFFDLGMSLLVLALAGGFIYSAERSHAEQVAAEVQTVAAAAAPATISGGEAAGTASALQ